MSIFRHSRKLIMKPYILLISFLFSICSLANVDPGRIYTNVQKLQSLKRVLYVAAHPDDENTRALAWLSLGEKAETAYFSLTRGDGGQNLIGDELGAELGVLRTQELLAARRYDGAKQYFSRAVDFGYSKSAEESFEKWGKDVLLEDLVLMIRKFRPDVIITRFPPDGRGGHGHHTASAILAIEAFEKAADKTYLPEQVKVFGAWKTTSIYWNTSYWWNEEIAELAKDDDDYFVQDIGGYDPLLGMSYNEIGTLARSQHKCQGFGAVLERGSRLEYFQRLGGEQLRGSFFEHSDHSWADHNLPKLDKQFQKLLDEFDFINPENNTHELFNILRQLESLPDSFFKDEKVKLCKKIIVDCLGLHIELLADDYAFVSQDSIELSLSIVNRASKLYYLNAVQLSTGEELKFKDTLKINDTYTVKLASNGNVELSTPFWLKSPFENVFVVDPDQSGWAENNPSITAKIDLLIGDQLLKLIVPATYKKSDPSYGERERPLVSTPSFTANFEQDIALLKPGQFKKYRLRVHSFQENLTDTIVWKAAPGWNLSQLEYPIEIAQKHGEQFIDLELNANSDAPEVAWIELFSKHGEELRAYSEISYDHIPDQVIFSKSYIKCVLIDAKITPGRIAYVSGVKDAVPQAIEALGYEVDVMDVSDLATVELSSYQSVVLGIRIYNVYPELENYNEKLYDYVANGGNLIMQYNTASRSVPSEFGPKPFKLSRNRVTEELAEVEFLLPDHALLNSPNQITSADFNNWVQERGLYFASDWDTDYEPILSWADRGEDPQHGALISLNHGKGRFIYTGISFFRELPNGVPGAYRLFANLLSYTP